MGLKTAAVVPSSIGMQSFLHVLCLDFPSDIATVAIMSAEGQIAGRKNTIGGWKPMGCDGA